MMGLDSWQSISPSEKIYHSIWQRFHFTLFNSHWLRPIKQSYIGFLFDNCSFFTNMSRSDLNPSERKYKIESFGWSNAHGFLSEMWLFTMPLRDGLPSPVIRTSSYRDMESDMRRWKKAQVTHLFLQIGTHVSGETTDHETVKNFHKVGIYYLNYFTYLRAKPQTILCCYCIVSCFPPDFHEVHPLGQLSPYGWTPHFMSGRPCTHFCVFHLDCQSEKPCGVLICLVWLFLPFLSND